VRLTAGVHLGPYRVDALLGAGGMGEVYKAQDTRLDRPVAIKVLSQALAADPHRRERFDREARAVAALNHPHICGLHDVGESPDPAADGTDAEPIRFLVMECLDGQTLADRLLRGPLTLPEVLRHAIELADALDHAHRRGLVHRDLKPGNVMMTAGGAMLLDFGLSRLQAAPDVVTLSTVSPGGTPITVEGTVLGTYPYMAPEQLLGREADARSDIFALGALLYEMTTGRRAFEGATAAALISAILHTDPPLISSLQRLAPPGLDRLVSRCLAKDPDDRWQTARDLALELKWIAESTPQASRFRLGRPKKPRAFGVAALGAGAVVAAIFAGVYVRRTQGESLSVQLTFTPPEGIRLVETRTAGPVTISPDGRRLVYVAAGDDGRQQLWVHALSSQTGQPLSGTDGAAYPFWAPDGRTVGFFAQGKLKRIDVDAGPAQVLCDAVLPRGGTWNRSAVIVFAANGGALLYRVAATGGPTRVLDFARPNRESHWPVFLPDGDHFLYFGRREKPGIYLASMISGDKGPVVEGQYVAADYMSPGHLLFQRGGAMVGTLHAQRFDLSRLRLTGEPTALVEHVAFYPFFARADFSVSQNGTLVYGSPIPQTTQLAWFDRAGNQLEQVAEGGGWEWPALAPDEKSIAAGRLDTETQSQDIWIIDASRGVTTRLTSDPALDGYPIWSPDGQTIVFGRTGREDDRTLYRIASGGGGHEEALYRFDSSAPLIRQFTHWSRDGRFMVYGGLDPQSKWDLWILPAGGEPVREDRKPTPYLRTAFNEHHGQLSWDGKWMAYASDESGRWEVYIGAFPASDIRAKVSIDGGIEPRWRSDGKELFYLSPDGTIMAVPISASTVISTGAPHALFKPRLNLNLDRGWNPHYVPARDGQRFLINVVEKAAQSRVTVVLNATALLRH
jgi:eukaryotic-like serine/threonine-protein kinase